MWYIYTMEYYSAIKKNEIMPFAVAWMDLESVILNEVRQRRKNIIWCPLYVESKEKWCKWTYLENRKTHRLREWTYGCQQGKEWEEGIIREFQTDMYIFLYLKLIIIRTYCIAQDRINTCIWMAESLSC